MDKWFIIVLFLVAISSATIIFMKRRSVVEREHPKETNLRAEDFTIIEG